MADFKYFVIFAEMRTGSNLLEASLNELDGITSFGELFNQHFIGGPKRDDVFGITLQMREKDPLALIKAMREQTSGMAGFRLFHDHDSRVIDTVIADAECAKIMLTRNPIDAFVSRKIAGATGQWKLGDAKDRKSAKIHFDMDEFEEYVSVRQSFQAVLRQKLQFSGQTAFTVTYDDIQDVGVVNGLARFLGVRSRIEQIPNSIKKQNPAPLSEKIKNPKEMRAGLKGFDWIDLEKAPNFEPERGPGVPRFLATENSNLLFLPIEGTPVRNIAHWLEELDGQPPTNGHSQKTLRQWLNKNSDRKVFTALRHPIDRAYRSFLAQIVLSGPEKRPAVRRVLENRYGVVVPEDPDQPLAIQQAFLSFLAFIESNLAGQTSVKTDPSWASQKAILDGMSKVIFPDAIFREDALAASLAEFVPGAPDFVPEEPLPAVPLAKIYNKDMETAARKAYRRDYLAFGFSDWA